VPKRVVDGEGIWGSDKILRLSTEFQPEYANLLPLAEANGVFEVNPHKVWSRVYAYNRRNVTVEWVQELLNELVEVGLLLIWEDNGKVWGFWDGNEKAGRLPKESEQKKYKNLPPNPPKNLSEVSAETQRRLSGFSAELPLNLPPRFGMVSNVMVSIGTDPAGLGSNFSNPENGQDCEEDVNLKRFKDEMATIGVNHGFKVKAYDDAWAELKTLTTAHGSQAVLNDFDEFLSESEGEEFPKGVLQKYQYIAADRLLGNSPTSAKAEIKSPAVTDLCRELTYMSDGVISFIDKQKIKLAELLKDWTVDEIKAVFREWLDAQDVNDAKNVQYLPGKFVQIADSKCYSLRRSRQEKAAEAEARAAKVKELQEAAERDLEASRKKREEEEQVLDPLGLFSDENNSTSVAEGVV